MGLLSANNGKVFCLPPNATPASTLQALIHYDQANHLPDAATEPQFLESLARIYPCGGALPKKNSTDNEYAGIQVGDLPSIMQTLENTQGHENDALVQTIEKNSGNYAPALFFPLANILFKQGDIDGAIFWFNAGRLRGTFDARLCTDRTAGAGIGTLVAMTPVELRKAQFNDLDKLPVILEKVIHWDETTPYNYDHRWIALHGMGAIRRGMGMDSGPPQPLTVPKEQWDALAQKGRAELREGMVKAIATMKEKQAGAGSH